MCVVPMLGAANLPIAGAMAGGLNLIYAGMAFGLTEACGLTMPGSPTAGCSPILEGWALVAILVGLGLLVCGGIFLIHEDGPTDP